MNFSLQPDGSILVQEITPFLATLLTEPFQKKNLEKEFLSKKFFKNINEKNAEFSHDWKEFVAPELSTLFASCHKMILGDLTRMQEASTKNSDHSATLIIPTMHREAWLRMLSMVRLELSTQYDFTQEELNAPTVALVPTSRGTALLQMQLFAIMQQYLIEAEGSGSDL